MFRIINSKILIGIILLSTIGMCAIIPKEKGNKFSYNWEGDWEYEKGEILFTVDIEKAGSNSYVGYHCMVHEHDHQSRANLTNSVFAGPCPGEVEDNRNYLKSFLTSEEWEQGRQETNIDHLSYSQINVLASPEFNATCETLNNRYQEAFVEKYSDGSSKYELTYYKVGNYYFVIISRRQPSDPNLVASGVEYITIYDENLNVIKGYFF
ncbi:MAG: hypothetical protein JXR26_10240 [Balneolaceae bacterium]|nr:hypothetical protein [Balneolaceae bacterium]